jgi:hypothetical protein
MLSALVRRLVFHAAGVCFAFGVLVVVLFVKERFEYNGVNAEEWFSFVLADQEYTRYAISSHPDGIYIYRNLAYWNPAHWPVSSPYPRPTDIWLIPFWLLLPMAAALQVWWAVYFGRRWRRSRRLTRGLCVKCGYDLRATPGRCPECGNEASGATASPPLNSSGAQKASETGRDRAFVTGVATSLPFDPASSLCSLWLCVLCASLPERTLESQVEDTGGQAASGTRAYRTSAGKRLGTEHTEPQSHREHREEEEEFKERS